MYGPSVHPELPPNYSIREKWAVSKNAADRQRRSVYIYAKRNLPYPLLKVFDFPDMHESCARRAETTVAPQSLMLLNSEMVAGYAAQMAGRLVKNVGDDDLTKLVDAAYEAAFGRPADSVERSEATTFIGRQRRLIEQSTATKTGDATLAAAFADFCHALLNSNEFLYVE